MSEETCNRSSLDRWDLYLTAAFSAVLVFQNTFWVLLSAVGLLAFFIYGARRAADVVTLLRILIATIAFFAAGWIQVGLFVLAFSLDGVDGWVARRFGGGSQHGEYFDMEADTFVLALLAVLSSQTWGLWPLILILFRPLYVFASQVFGVRENLSKNRESSLLGKWGCALTTLVLILSLAVNHPVVLGLFLANIVLLMVSFASDFARVNWSWRSKARLQ